MSGRPAVHRRRSLFWRWFDYSPAYLLLCLLVFSMPLENSLTIPDLGTWSRLIGLIVVAAVGLEAILGRALRPAGEALLPLGLFMVWSAITYFWSSEPEITVDRLATNLRLLLLVWVVWQCARTVQLQERLLQFFLAGTFCAALDTVLRSRRNQAIDEIRFAGAGWDPNDLALILALSVAVAVFLAAKSPSKLVISIYGAHILLAIGAILLTGSRGSFLAFCAGGAVIVWFRCKDRSPFTPANVALICAIAVLCLVLIPDATWNRLGTIYEEMRSGTFTKRTLIWTAGLEAFADRPLLGTGAGTFGAVVLRTLDQEHAAHNTYLSVLLETGVVGFGLLGFVALTCAWVILRLPAGERRLWMSVLVMLGVGMFSLTWEYKKTLWLLLALLMSRGDLIGTRRSFRPVPAATELKGTCV